MQNVSVDLKMDPLGFSAFAISILALACVWIPLIGISAIPLSIAAGVIGIATIVRRRGGVGLAIGGCALCATTLLIGISHDQIYKKVTTDSAVAVDAERAPLAASKVYPGPNHLRIAGDEPIVLAASTVGLNSAMEKWERQVNINVDEGAESAESGRVGGAPADK